MLLDRVDVVYVNPFPHVVIRRALPPALYRDLYSSRPTPEEIIGGREVRNNARYDMATKDCLTKTAQNWQEFCAFHSSQKFFDRVLEVFGETIEKKYPEWDWSRVTPPVRPHDGEAGMECQIGLNTPAPEPSTVCGPHIDNPRELYAGLLYMRNPDDSSEGGDFTLYRWKDGRRFSRKRDIPEDAVEAVKAVKYEPNTYVMFINGPEAAHGVTPRKSGHYRNLVNVILDMPESLFEL